MRNPFESTSVLLRRSEGVWSAAGTCFAFKRRRWFLTAGHCVRGAEAADLGLIPFAGPAAAGSRGLDIDALFEHPVADVALLRRPIDGLGTFDPFEGFSLSSSQGEAVTSFGYPSEARAPAGGRSIASAPPAAPQESLVPRMLRGHVQRRFLYEGHGYSFKALELSLPAPAGMSGAPVSLDENPSNVLGLIADNHDASTLLHKVSEVEDGRSVFRESMHAVVTYGVAVDLSVVDDWIMDTIGATDA